MALPLVRSGVPTMVRIPARRATGGPGQSANSSSRWSRSGKMDLPVFANHRAGQVSAADGRTQRRVGIETGSHLLGALADADRPFVLVAFGDTEGDAGGAEQTRGRLGDLAQRAFGVTGRGGNGAQNVGGGGLPFQGFAQFLGAQLDLSLQTRVGFLQPAGHVVEYRPAPPPRRRS